jgi:hypothetical protein
MPARFYSVLKAVTWDKSATLSRIADMPAKIQGENAGRR